MFTIQTKNDGRVYSAAELNLNGDDCTIALALLVQDGLEIVGVSYDADGLAITVSVTGRHPRDIVALAYELVGEFKACGIVAD